MKIACFLYLSLLVLFSSCVKIHNGIMGSNQGIISFDQELVPAHLIEIKPSNNIKRQLNKKSIQKLTDKEFNQ